MTTCALSYMSTRVRACLRAGACMRACQWSRLAEEYVRLRRFSARVTPAFSSFGSLPFFLRTLHSPFSPFSVSRDRCSSTLLVTSSRAHRARFETLCFFCASRNFTSPKKLDVFSCTVVGRTSQRNKEEENDDRVEDVLPGQACPAVQRRISFVLSAANKVIIIVAGKAPGGKRATSSSSVYTFPGVSKCVRECVSCARSTVYTHASLYVYTLRFTCGACAAPSDDSRAPTSCGVGVSVAMKTIGYL